MSLPADSRYSEIEGFWLRKPQATPAEVHEFTGEVTARLCDCKQPLRRFETWNGFCEECRRERFSVGKEFCGCYDAERRPMVQFNGWHLRAGGVGSRCPGYWNGRTVEVEITRKEAGRTVKRKADLVFRLNDDESLHREYRIDGIVIDVSGKRGDYGADYD